MECLTRPCRGARIWAMGEADQLVPYVNCWNPLDPVAFEPWIPNAAAVDILPSPNCVLSFLPQHFLAPYSQSVQIDHTVNYVCQPSDPDEDVIQRALDAFNQLLACEPGHVIEAFADYLSERNADWLRNVPRQEPVSSSAISSIPIDRQVRIETAAKDHVLHLETMILAEEQDAPNKTAVGPILISGGELWMRWGKKLLHSLSRYSRNRSTVGFQIALANAAQA
jgi:hypothetical protein